MCHTYEDWVIDSRAPSGLVTMYILDPQYRNHVTPLHPFSILAQLYHVRTLHMHKRNFAKRKWSSGRGHVLKQEKQKKRAQPDMNQEAVPFCNLGSF